MAQIVSQQDFAFAPPPKRRLWLAGPNPGRATASRMRSSVAGAVFLTLVGGYGVMVGDVSPVVRHSAYALQAMAQDGFSLAVRPVPVVFPEPGHKRQL